MDSWEKDKIAVGSFLLFLIMHEVSFFHPFLLLDAVILLHLNIVKDEFCQNLWFFEYIDAERVFWAGSWGGDGGDNFA